MLYDSNAFKPYIYVLFFQDLPMCHTYINILLVLHQNPLNIIFLGSFEVYGTVEAVFTGHVRPVDRTYPASWTCPAPGPDMSGYRVSSLYKGAERPPLNPNSFFLLHTITCGDQGFSRRFWVFSTKSLRFLEDLTPLLLRIIKP
jgi:hypothetical protein